MYKRVNESVSYCLKGKVLRCSFEFIIARILMMLFVMYVVAVMYLLVFDTSLIVSIGLYQNQYMAAGVCALSVIVGCILFASAHWASFSAKYYTWSQMQKLVKRKTSVNAVLRLIAVRVSVKLLKTFITVTALFPSIFCFSVLYFKLQVGISKITASVWFTGCVMICIIGVVTALLICKRYYLAEYCICDGASISEILQQSVYLMDSKCFRLFKYQLRNIPLIILGLFIPHLSVIADAREFFFVTDKTIEYARKAHTQQKTVVFYCNRTTA